MASKEQESRREKGQRVQANTEDTGGRVQTRGGGRGRKVGHTMRALSSASLLLPGFGLGCTTAACPLFPLPAPPPPHDALSDSAV